MRTMQTLLNIVDFGMNLQQARWTTRGRGTRRAGAARAQGRDAGSLVDELERRDHG